MNGNTKLNHTENDNDKSEGGIDQPQQKTKTNSATPKKRTVDDKSGGENAAKVVKVTSDKQTDVEQMEYSTYSTAQEGFYMMEFRVVLGDYRLPVGGRLVMYLQSQENHLSLNYNEKIRAYQAELPLPITRAVQIYKFAVKLPEVKELLWERIPQCRHVHVWNRMGIVSTDQGGKHFVMFDVVCFEEMSSEKYDETLQSEMLKLLPTINLNHISSDNIEMITNLYDQWARAYACRKQIADGSNKLLFSIKINENQEIFASCYRSLKADKFGVTDVFESLCMFLALRNHISNLDAALKSTLCLNMSVERLNDKEFDLFLKLFGLLKAQHGLSKVSSKNNFENYFKALTRLLDDVPEYIFVFPLLKLAMIDVSAKISTDPPPNYVLQSFRNKMRKSAVFQRRRGQYTERDLSVLEVTATTVYHSVMESSHSPNNDECQAGQLWYDSTENQTQSTCSSFESYKKFDSKRHLCDCCLSLKGLLDLHKSVFLLSERFPWISNLFVEALNLNSVASLLNSDLNRSPCLNVVLMKKVSYFWMQLNNYSSSEKLTDDVFVKICSYISEEFKKKLQSTKSESCEQKVKERSSELFSICLKIPKEMRQHFKRNRHAVNFVFLNHTFLLFDGVIECSQRFSQEQNSKNIEKLQDDILTTAKCLIKEGYSVADRFDVGAWNCLSKMPWSDTDFLEKWKQTVRESITTSIQQSFADVKHLIEYYCDEFDRRRPNKVISEWFTDVVVNDFVNFVNNQGLQRNLIQRSWDKMKKALYVSSGFEMKIRTLCMKILQRQWKSCPEYRTDDSKAFFSFVQNWDTVFIQTLVELKMTNQLPSELKNKFSLIEKSSNKVMVDLLVGAITLASLQKLMEIRSSFFECLSVTQTKANSSSVDQQPFARIFHVVLDLRVEELKTFFSAKTSLQEMLSFLQSITKGKIELQCEELREQLEQNIESLPLKHLVACREHKPGSPSPTPRLMYFDLSAKHLSLVRKLHRNKVLPLQSAIVKKQMATLVKTAQDAGFKEISFSEALENLWKPLQTRVTEIVETIDNETILLKDVDKIFGDGQKNGGFDRGSLVSELSHLYGVANEFTLEEGKKSRHFKLLSNYSSLKQNLLAAKILKRMEDILGLAGDFDSLDQILGVAGDAEELQLSAMIGVRKTNKVLEIVSKHDLHLKTLLYFVQAEPLVNWLKTSIKDSKEVKVMIDLAMISAGEVPMEVDKVSCFNSAVMGFSPLLFNLYPDNGLDELLEACQEVWENVKADSTLLDKWKAASHQLAWLDYVKGFDGSVEKSSLEKAETINSKGLYVIKCDKDAIPTVENSIDLIVKEAATEMKMSLNDLRDLQSRLMLIAGESAKGEVDVTRFMKVLSSVENLTKTYVKLKISGCPLFNDWSANVRCENERSGNVTVEVFFDEKCQAISSSENIINELVRLTEILDEAYLQWMNYLTENRNKHYHLNHFNIQQLTYLCKELASTVAADYNEQVYQLLASVLPDADEEAIFECLEEATRVDEIERLKNMPIAEDEENLSEIEKKKNMVRKLVKLELTEKVAKAAVQAVGYDDLDDCLIWALSYADDVEELVQQFDNEIGFEPNQYNSKVIQNIVNDKSDLTLKEVISRLQSDAYSEKANMSTIVKTICKRYFTGTSVTSLEDYLSLEHCGKFLTYLAKRRDQASLPRRDWTGCFVEEKPNLLICRRPNDMLLMLLSLYMQSPNESLPSTSEVLLCSEETSAEDVELLFRRAIGVHTDAGERIYCLANANVLPFNVSKKAEECFENLMQIRNRNERFRLVILTCDEQHYLTSCFYEQKVEGFVYVHDVSTHLRKHLSRKRTAYSAARIDENCSSAIVVRSGRSGMGKSLYISRCRDKISNAGVKNVSTIRLLEKYVDVDDVIRTLGRRRKLDDNAHFVHIDITPSVQAGKSKLLFDLLILGRIQNSRGVVWRHQPTHLYMLEYTDAEEEVDIAFSKFFGLLPSVTCLSPIEVRDNLQENPNRDQPADKVFMDAKLLRSEMYQRPFQYLRGFRANENLDEFTYLAPHENSLECLTILLEYCSFGDPSWSELCHFSKFLNTQLHDCEESDFCNTQVLGNEFQGFKAFVVRFMIRMAQDFAMPSLSTGDDASDGDSNGNVDDDDNDLLERHRMKRKWESSFHPYVFFNADRQSMSFANFNVNNQGTLCHPKTKHEVEQNLMRPELVQALTRNYVNLQQDIDKMTREQKLAVLCQVFGVANVVDPDKTYELTSDNVVKMLAIQMRFRCRIPVVIMGETGCGKTRMVDFMSKLKAEGNRNVRNMVVVKVHGGVTASMVQEKVEEAINLAKQNKGRKIWETILFLDEANTTEAIYAIKEIMCDETVCGRSFADTGLRIVAACNPYRAHPPEIIDAMEKSGLGFHVRSEDVSDTFDDIPMRHLVYRVIALPPSMHPLVWDFGQLSNDTEEIYINQMVVKLVAELKQDAYDDSINDNSANTITRVVTASQVYMREQRAVCKFVSLRDAERTMQVFKWFYQRLHLLNPLIDEEKDKNFCLEGNISNSIRALIQAVSICYNATLDERESYRDALAREIRHCENIDMTEQTILDEITACQNVFINAIQLEKNIACNEALRENVFMMVICAEMRIPLFLVGKPGSSKSLAKTIVTDAMQGKRSKTKLYQSLKEIHVLSFQCSAATDAVGVEAVFAQCAQLQKNKNDYNKYVAMVVLDEIGLAEDSKKMPLKVLHPLLETASTTSSSNVENHQRVGFVGISNWALDPAKMNRGIFVTRGKPTNEDLHKTAEAIFQSDPERLQNASRCIKAVTDAYLELYQAQAKEFFGLRDYYAMMKMLFASRTESLTFNEVGTAVIRNFSGASDEPLNYFQKHCKKVFSNVQMPHIPVTRLMRNNLDTDIECRFLMILTKQYSAVNLLPEILGNRDYVVIFGSSFPHDHDYTEVCKNINKIKVCMETGRTVVLLNLRDLYESLYDALNQHYVTFAAQRYVDLGLGGHRVKCRVASDFKLIVVEEKEVVYDEYPIPLINRLEKHVFDMSSVLATDDKTTINYLKNWVESSCNEFTAENTFLGYNEDSCASALLSSEDRSFEATQKILLQTATLDGVCRFSKGAVAGHAENLLEIYMHEQIHDSLWMFLEHELEQQKISVNEIVTFSQVLNERDRHTVQTKLETLPRHCMVLILQQFQTEQQFSERVDQFLEYVMKENMNPSSGSDQRYILLIQCSQAHKNASLTACAKYSTMNKIQNFKKDHFDFEGSFAVCFLFTMERNASSTNSNWSYVNFYCKDCSTIYVDELKPNSKPIAPVSKLWSMSVQEVIGRSFASEEGPVNINQLMRESIPIAMAKLQNRVVDSKKNRIQLILSMCFENRFLSPFYKMLLKKILRLIEDRESKMEGRDNWIVGQACSARALQEGGTFKNVLWLRIKNIVAVALAKVVSIADADDNLNLLEKSVQDCKEIAELWFQIFNKDDLWDLQWTNVSMNSPETSFIVEGCFGFSCSFPFSRSILNTLKKEHQKLQEAPHANQHDNFFYKVERSSIGWVFDTAEQSGMTALQRFAFDLIRLMYKPRSAEVVGEEYDTVLKYVLHLHKLLRQSERRNVGNALVEVFLLLLENTKDLQTFAETVEIYPDVIFHCNSCIDEIETDTFCLHHVAFECVVKHLDEVAKESFGKVLSCNQWKSLVVKTKQISDKMLHAANDLVQKMWQRIVFVEMFLDELLPSAASENIVIRYLKPLSLQARLLWSGAVAIKDLSMLRFLKIVVNSLKKCTKEMELRLLCNWKDISCKACKRDSLVNPVELHCGHYFCQRCITGNKCPVCRRDIDESDLLQPMQLTGDRQREMNVFKLAGTSFFLEYLSTICFPTDQRNLQNVTEEMFLALEELVINNNRTKIISPVLAEIDLNPTARSYILQLLLRCDEKLVEQQLGSHFRKMERVLNDRTALMGIYIKCKQDILLHQSSVDGHDMENSSVIFAYRVLREANEELPNANIFSQLEHLRTCAMLQFVAKIAVSCFMQTSEKHLSEEALFKITTFINALYRFCAGPEFLIFRQFIIKCLCRRYGTDALNIMLENDLFRKLVPENLLPQAGEEKDSYFHADRLCLTGERYRRTKTLLLDIAQESDEDTVLQQIVEGGVAGKEVTEILLAASTWVAYDRNPARLRTFQHLCQQLPQNTFFQVFTEVAQGQFEALRWKNTNANLQYSLTELLVHFGATISNSQDNLLGLFREFAANPDYFINFYLPTMPATNYAAIRSALGVAGMLRSHLCPNGHPYYIGECGRPVVQGRCPECGAPIGGTSHRLAQGNHPGEAAEKNQTGYKPRKTTSVVPERQLSKLSVCATRICLHLAMLLGSRNGNGVARMVQRNQEVDFLFEEIHFDLKETAKLLGRGAEDAFMLIHLIFNRMRTIQNPAQQRHSWNSLNERETWENEFQRCFLTPICSNANNHLDQAQDIMMNVGKLTEKPLERLVFELKKDEILPDGIVPWNTPNLWKYMMHVDINHLRQTLESVDGNSTADGAALKLIVNSENLEVIQHLYTIITVQSAFIKKYRQRIDMSNADEITIQDFLYEENYEDEIEIYIQVWNKVRLLQLNADRYNIPPSYLEEMSRDSPISMCLPSRRGMGLCAFILADYLMEKQNDLLLACRELVEPKPSLKAVDVGDLDSNYLICINSMEDLMPIVLENSQYETTVTDNGLKHNISYNLGLLQKKILQKFFYRKRIINKETLPMMKYPQDMGLANDFQAVQNESKQILLPLKLCQEVDDLIENCLTAKLCEVVRTLTLVVQFLAKDTSISGEQRIFEFAEKELLLPPEETEMIPRSALISHCLALYERLSWHRSKRLIQNGQNPFENVVENSEDIQDKIVLEELKATLTTRIRPHIDSLQLELNALLMVGPHMEPDWRLGEDVLLQYLELKEEEIDTSWCEQIPPEILFKHAVHVFNICMEYAAK